MNYVERERQFRLFNIITHYNVIIKMTDKIIKTVLIATIF